MANRRSPRYYIHVDSGCVRKNRKTGGSEPPVVLRKGRSGEGKRFVRVPIRDAAGNVVAWVSYEPHRPLKCGAVVAVHCLYDPSPDPEVT